MTTCKELLDEILAMLHGYGSTRDRVTTLTAPITATDSQFTVDATYGQSVGLTPGIVEIDSEQLYVTAIDSTTNIATIANGFGRGYADTTAASHLAGAKVISNPRWPRIWLFKQLNEIIGGVYPQLFVPNQYTTTVSWPSNTYTLPNTNGTPMSVIDAQWQDPIGNWQRCQSYVIDPYDGSFRLGSGAIVGRPLRILYASQPKTFTSESDDFSVTGLPASAADVLTLGVVAKLVPGLDISRAQLSSVEQSDRSRVVPPYAGVKAAQFVFAEFQDRLKNEAQSLRKQYRSRMTRVW